MKKIILSGLVAMSLATIASAGSVFVEGSVGGLTATSSTTEPTATTYGIGIGWDSLDNKAINESTLYFGWNTNIDYGSFEFDSGTTADNYDFGIDIFLGYNYKMGSVGAIQPYGKLGVRRHTLNYSFTDGTTDSITGSGFEYGGGLRYQPTAHFTIGVDYMKSTIKFSGADVDFDHITGTIAYRW
jgi:opacity protein-like surface antigen